MLIFYLESIYTSCTTYSLYLFFRSLAQSTSYARGLVDYSLRCVGDCSDYRACLRSQPRSATYRLVSTLGSKIVPTTEHIYVPNHARELVHQSLRRARGLCRPPSMFTFLTMLGDWSTSFYAVLGDCADHRARLHSNRARRPALCSGLASITLQP